MYSRFGVGYGQAYAERKELRQQQYKQPATLKYASPKVIFKFSPSGELRGLNPPTIMADNTQQNIQLAVQVVDNFINAKKNRPAI
ncbi:MAG: hypothetical protein P4L28_11950 [Paludibacteraceae bacterium]|nr:hypothetical protein [Paludibacteraceae bacterium]